MSERRMNADEIRAVAPRWVLRVGLLSDVGRARERNEDAMAAYLPYQDTVPAARGDALFLVADGMGGHEAGDVASAFVAGAVRTWFTQLPPADDDGENFPALLRGLLEMTNQALNDLARREGLAHGAGSTATVACFRAGRLHVAHVGDTRLYRVRDGVLEQLTEDHSWVAEQLRAGLLDERTAADHPQRHMLTECLGIGPDVAVFTTHHDVHTGDRFLLSSDGLHGPLDADALARVLADEPDPQQAARRLVALANSRSGADNITAVVVHVDPPVDALAGAPESLAVTVPGVAAPFATQPGAATAPATTERWFRSGMPRLLLLSGSLALVLAAVAGDQLRRRGSTPDAGITVVPTDTTPNAPPSSRSVPEEGTDTLSAGRTHGDDEQ